MVDVSNNGNVFNLIHSVPYFERAKVRLIFRTILIYKNNHVVLICLYLHHKNIFDGSQ